MTSTPRVPASRRLAGDRGPPNPALALDLVPDRPPPRMPELKPRSPLRPSLPDAGELDVRRTELGIGRLFEHMRDGVIVADERGTIVLWNPAAERMFGWSAQEAMGRNVRMLVPPRHLADHERGMAGYARSGHGRLIDTGHLLRVPALRKDGGEISVEMTLSPVRDGGLYSIALLRDVTPTVRLEAELDARDREAKFHQRVTRLSTALIAATALDEIHRGLQAFVQESLPQASAMFLSLLDRATGLRTCVYAHAEGEDIDVSSLPPMPFTDSPHSRAVQTGEVVVTPDLDAALVGKPRADVGLERDPRLPRSSLVVPLKLAAETIGGLELQSTTPAAFREEDLPPLLLAAHLAAIAIQNVRLRQQLEHRVKERTRQLDEKNQELRAFSFTVAHDLKAPIRAANHLVQETLEHAGTRLTGPEREDLGAAATSMRRMGDLIDDLLTLATADQGDLRREDVDLTILAEGIVQELRARSPERAARVAIEPDLRARADRRLVRIVLDNLLRNAWKYSAKKPETVIRVGKLGHASEPTFYVQDQGAGFEPREAGRLFQPFQRLHPPNEYEGTGIGLATVGRIVRRHGGRVWADGRPGQGATFYFTLPER